MLKPGPDSGLAPIARRMLGDDVLDALRTAVLDGRFVPGQRLAEAALARDLQVSRTDTSNPLPTNYPDVSYHCHVTLAHPKIRVQVPMQAALAETGSSDRTNAPGFGEVKPTWTARDL